MHKQQAMTHGTRGGSAPATAKVAGSIRPRSTASSSPPSNKTTPAMTMPRGTSRGRWNSTNQRVIKRDDGNLAGKHEPAQPALAVTMETPAPSSQPLREPLRTTATRHLSRSVSSITTEADEVRRLRMQLQSMKEQVHFMHKMMQELSVQEKQLLKGKYAQVPSKRLSFAGISPVKKTRGSVDVIVMPDEQIPFPDQWKLPEHTPSFSNVESYSMTQVPAPSSTRQAAVPTAREKELQSQLEALQLQNDTLKARMKQQQQDAISTDAEYRGQIDALSSKLAVLDSENLELHAHIEEFEEENIRLHGTLAQLSNQNERSTLESISNQGESADISGDLDGELGIDGVGAVVEDVHERCEVKIHELWQTIKTLKTYVEAFRIEIDDLRVQRDNAVQSAERAWGENAKLAGNNNPQQKIKYVETLKNENAEMVQKVRQLQSQLTKKQLKESGDATTGMSSMRSSEASQPLDEYPSSGDEPIDDGSDQERTKLLKNMWARNKKLEDDIGRLRKEKQALVNRPPPMRSLSNDSRKSSTRPSSTSSSSRWKS